MPTCGAGYFGLYVLLLFQCIYRSAIDDYSGAMKLQSDKEEVKKEKKLQSDKEKVKKEKKEKKRREKKSRDPQSLEHKDRSWNKRKHDELYHCSIDAKDYAAEHLEKSDLTEENGPPAFVLNSYDSGSTLDCLKKRRLETPSCHKNEGKASVIRIRLPSKRLRDGLLPSTRDQKLVLVNREDAVLPKTNYAKLPLPKHNDVEHHRLNDVKLPGLEHEKSRNLGSYAIDLKLRLLKHEDAEMHIPDNRMAPSVKQKDVSHDMKLPFVQREDGGLHRPLDHSISLVKHIDAEVARPPNSRLPVSSDEPCCSGKLETPSDSTSHASTHFEGSRRVRKFDWKFRDLIMSWKPPLMDHVGSSDFDHHWLLGSRRPHSGSGIQIPDLTCRSFSDAGDSVGGSMQIRACYMPENDIYALPFVVPY